MTAPTTELPYFDLGKTASYRRRRIFWFEGRGDRDTDRIGTLRIVLEKTKSPSDSTEVDEYGVQEEFGRGLPVGVRSFMLRNDTDAEQPDVYRCVVGADAGGLVQDLCTCEAGKRGKDCKHKDALNKLVERWVV